MNCEDAQQGMTAERYVAGQLGEAARAEFEEHYFGCDRCFGEVEVLRAVKAGLPRARRKPFRVWLAAMPIAAAILLAVFLWPQHSTRPAPTVASMARDYSALARFDPPAWKPVVLRGRETAEHEAFVKAMASYTARDYAGCAEKLKAIRSTQAHYYEGICLLLGGDKRLGIATLYETVSAGDTPYREEAHYYSAKGWLSLGNAAAARHELEAVVAMHGDLEREAAELLNQLK
jgi:hypothetical protein